MQLKLAAFTTLFAAATLAAATVTPAKRTGAPSYQCNTGKLLCCNTVQPSTSATAAGLIGLVGAVVGDITVPVGITCSPISKDGIAGESCSAQPICCTDNSFNGVISLGCSGVNGNA